VNVYTTCIYVYICMYVCTCACIHVHVCHVYIVCHEYIYTCIHLCVVHLDIILLFVKDGDEVPKIGNVCLRIQGQLRVMNCMKFWFILRTTSLHQIVYIPLTPGRKDRVCCFGGTKNRAFETKGPGCRRKGTRLAKLFYYSGSAHS